MTEAPARCAPGTPCWTSLMVHDLAATRDFYHALFGWDFTPGPREAGSCVRAVRGGHPVAGIGTLPPERRAPVAWTTYLASDDADETAEQIRACGGTVAVGPLDAQEAGRLVIAADPAGGVFGVWQTRSRVGAVRSGALGTPVWHELLTQETAAVGKFYAGVFGLGLEVTAADADRGRLSVGGRPVAGLQGMGSALPRDRGTHWVPFFAVRDADAAARTAVDLGGALIRPPRDGAIGRRAVVADPEGAVFAVVRTDG
ncbi:VOC family protein [Streptomyces palmae]|uniref:VOC family protein n=1 Tax=Streptomyces palmae TaxID=1701085 RepID=A0A4Z0HBX5_9ACTN|nr:VOC family protein [Streptomyces palmae]TGB16894.1 VOC family protein [Streptomyces palmae]